MRERPYFSIRTGNNPNVRCDLPMLRRLFYQSYAFFDGKEYFQEAFGYYCVDNGDVLGSLGPDIGAYLFRKLRKVDLWPIAKNSDHYSEDDIFDLVEFLNDSVSKPVDGYYHDYSRCGWHYASFDRETGRHEFRAEINDILRGYGQGFELSELGEVYNRVPDDMQPVFETILRDHDPANVTDRIQVAKTKYTRRGAALDDKRDAVRDLADVLEFLRPRLNEVMTSRDEADLFNLANSFGIRHHDGKQKVDYDRTIWYDWMFFYYLNTISAVLKLIDRAQSVEPDDVPF